MGEMLRNSRILAGAIIVAACSPAKEQEPELIDIAACNCDIDPQPCCCTTPIVLDIAGDGVTLTSWQEGVSNFPLVPWRPTVPRAWTEPGTDDAWLTLDTNEDGLITSGIELFGETMPQPSPPDGEDRNGFMALAQYDENGDRVIDDRDEVYEEIRLWQDRNHDGVSQTDELLTLADTGVAGLSLDYDEHRIPDGNGNVIRYSADVFPAPGSTVAMTAWDVLLSSPTKKEREAYGIIPIPVPEATLPHDEDGGDLGTASRSESAIAIAGNGICNYRRHIYNPYKTGTSIATEGSWDLNIVDPCVASSANIRMRLRNRWLDSWHWVATNTATVPQTYPVYAAAPCYPTGASQWQATMRTYLVGSGSPIDLGVFDAFTLAFEKNCNAFQPPEDDDCLRD